MRQRLAAFLAPLAKDLDFFVDARLVRTFVGGVEAILRFRHRSLALLLSELGAYLLSPETTVQEAAQVTAQVAEALDALQGLGNGDAEVRAAAQETLSLPPEDGADPASALPPFLENVLTGK